MKKPLLSCIAICLICTGCKEKNTPSERQRDTSFNTGTAVFYGAYYQDGGIAQNVLSVDLYSSGLTLDSTGHVTGTGTNLYFSDVFLAPADTFLLAGTYLCDSTALPMTFLPGMNYEGNISGAYILDIVDGALNNAELLTEGRFSLEYKGDSVQMDFALTNQAGKACSARFKGLLPLYDGRKQECTRRITHI